MGLKRFISNLTKVENVEKKYSTKAFLIFAGSMIVVILGLVVILSLI